MIRPVILVYHGVDEVAEADDPSRLVVSPHHLRSHVRLLQGLGYRFLTAEQTLDRWAGARPDARTAVLTFDDGFLGWRTRALPLLAELGVPATFYVCPGWWGGRHPDVTGPAGRLLGEEDARALVEAGMELGSHTMTHPDLRALDDPRLEEEVVRSKREVEAVSGRPCRTFAYPFGLFGEREERAVEAAGYELALGWLPGPWRTYGAPRLPGPPRHGAMWLALKLLGLRRPGR
jgi:peptidoglycan/xylan/chitin deacetylase (PgdA/CDA1 family)